MTISVIIVSYNSGPLLIECVRSVLGSTVIVEVLVSDNGSTDGSIEGVGQLAATDSRLQLIENGCNLGFARANNIALSRTSGEYVLFLNPDCIVLPNTLALVLAALVEHADAGMAGCLIRTPDGQVEPNCSRRLPTPIGLIRRALGRGSTEAPSLPGTSVVEAISGAFMLARRDDLDRIGAFDDAYFMHWEDLDLCRRFRDAGRQLLFVSDVEIVHFKGHSSRRTPLRVEWYKHRGMLRYLRKFHLVGWLSLLLPVVAGALAFSFVMRTMLRHPWRSCALAGREASAPEPDEVWVFGASSLVGRTLLPRLLAAGYRVRAYCSDPELEGSGNSPQLVWQACDLRSPGTLPSVGQPLALICLAPVFALSPQLSALAALTPRSVIAFSSNSALTKAHSSRAADRDLAAKLRGAESDVRQVCEQRHIRWAILRPTMVYSLGFDRNVTRLSGLIRRFGFFALPGKGRGMRQPVHADDLAKACIQLLKSEHAWNHAYDLSGGEVLSYRAMIEALFRQLWRRPLIVRLPDWIWRVVVLLAQWVPGYRELNLAMIKRVDADLVVSHDEARRAFGFAPRDFLR